MFYLIFFIGVILSINKNRSLSAKIYTGILMILAALRYGSGPDYFSYWYLYEQIKKNIFEEIFYGLDGQELGFRLLGAFFKYFNLSYQVYISIFAIITLLYIYKISIKYSENPVLSITIYYTFYYFVWTFSGIRQGLVMSIGMYYLLDVITSKQYKKFIIIVFLLSSIHASAFILLILLLIEKLRFDRRKMIVLLFASIIMSILPIGVIIIELSKYIPILDRVVLYTNSDLILNNILDLQTLGRLFFIIILIFYYDKYIKEYPEQQSIINIYFLSFIIYFTFKFSELTAARLGVYGKMLDMIILSNIISIYKEKWERFICTLLLILVMSLYLFKELYAMEKYTKLVDSNLFSTPYVNIFNKEDYDYKTRFKFLELE